MNHLIDTNVLIAYSHRRPQAVALLEGLAATGHDLATCAIVVAEVYSGTRTERERERADQLFDRMQYLDLTRSIAERAGALRGEYAARGVSLSVSDTLLASLALAHDIPFATGNVKDFPMPGLRLVEVPTT